MNTEIQLQGRRVLVTGSARGLGESFVRALVQAGARVVVSDVLHERGQALAAELGQHYVPLDLLDPQNIQAGVDQAAHRGQLAVAAVDGSAAQGALAGQ